MQAAQQTSIGGYRVTGQLRAGGLGTVYTAFHERHGRKVTLTVLAPQYAAQRAAVDQYFQQTTAASSIKHPGVVEIHETGYLDSGVAFVAAEALTGEYLDVRLGKGLLPVKQALRFAGQLAATLAAVHASGIVHRALAPDKVFIVRDPGSPGGERIKVLDFGVAHFSGAPNPAQAAQAISVALSPKYMAPEQCQGQRAVDHRADLYSLGCVVFALLCGRPPFDSGVDARAIIAAHLQQPPPAPTSLRSELPRDIDAVLSYLLVKDPNRRYQSAVDLTQSLSVILGEPIAFATQPGKGDAPVVPVTAARPVASASAGPLAGAAIGAAGGAGASAAVGPAASAAIGPASGRPASVPAVSAAAPAASPAAVKPAVSRPPPPVPAIAPGGAGAVPPPPAGSPLAETPRVPALSSAAGSARGPGRPAGAAADKPAGPASGPGGRIGPPPALPLAAPAPTDRVAIDSLGYDGPTDRMTTEPYMPDAPTRQIETKLTPRDGIATSELEPADAEPIGATQDVDAQRHMTTERLDGEPSAVPRAQARVLVRKVDPDRKSSNRGKLALYIAAAVVVVGGAGALAITLLGGDEGEADAVETTAVAEATDDSASPELPAPELTFVALGDASSKPSSGPAAEGPGDGRVRWTIASAPAGAEVLRGDEVVGVTPLVVELDRSPRFTAAFTLRREGYDDSKVELSGDASSEASVELVPQVPIVVESTPEGAEIFGPDGESLGVTPAEIYLSRGDDVITLTLKREGYADGTLDVVPDEKTKKSVELVAQRSMVTVRITSQPAGATVRKNGEKVGTTPFEEEFLQEKGKLRYTLDLDGYRTRTVRLPGDRSSEQEVKLKLKRKTRSRCPKNNARSDTGGPVFVDPYDPCQ